MADVGLLALAKDYANRLFAKHADYMVERGVSGNCTYEKWHSGKAVCYGSIYAQPVNTTLNGTIYYSPSLNVTLPISFVKGNAIASSSDPWAGVRNVYVSNNVLYFKITSPHQWTDVTYNISVSFYIVGAWK